MNRPPNTTGENAGLIGRWWTRVEAREIKCVVWAFAWFYFILLSYFTIRPIRETMGIEGGTEKLPHLFLITFLAMLVAVPIYSAVVARLPRRWLVRVVYHFFAGCLLLFWSLLQVESELVHVWTARVIFIWINIFALFATSVFWSVLADLFRSNQAKRLFGLIAAGGTLGAITGSFLTSILATRLSTDSLLLIPAALLELGLACAWRLELNSHHLLDPDDVDTSVAARSLSEKSTGGGLWTGITQVFSSSYLASICLFLFLIQAFATQLYLQQADIVNHAIELREARTAFFAKIDLGTQLLTLLLQTTVAGAILRRLGISVALSVLPLIYMFGFAALASAPTLGVLMVIMVCTRAGAYGITVPSREVLFTVVSREQKYKSKSFIDTVVLRGGDALSSQLFGALQKFGASLTAMNWYAVPLTTVWLLIAWRLGRSQERRAKS
ncbi:major facilitator transporter [Rhodopirellula maiorica SM1]|uniref:Major facilitator transporter n=1 Tax=Rhodopirellula maiorica SM1 TaxID=1265738 RepID=M5RJ35_9BACT|nr:MFS transporter [Rhodopirellula maiorica]EMI19290.1 major facilitator transporter [Rhodopirellula maiorica SM1]